MTDNELLSERDQLKARVAELEEQLGHQIVGAEVVADELWPLCVEMAKALEPFARVADMEQHEPDGASVMVNVTRCRDARTVLSRAKDAGVQS